MPKNSNVRRRRSFARARCAGMSFRRGSARRNAVRLRAETDYAQYPNQTNDAKYLPYAGERIVFLMQRYRKIPGMFFQTAVFLPRTQFLSVCARFFRRFARLPAPRFCATIIPDRFPATDGQGGAQPPGSRKFRIRDRCACTCFHADRLGSVVIIFNAMLSFFVALLGAE